MKKLRVLQAVYYTVKGKFVEVDIEYVYRIATRDIVGMPAADLLKIGQEIFAEQIRPRIFHEAIATIQKHRSLKHRVVLLTSGSKMIMEHMQNFLGADECHCVSLGIKDGLLTDKLNLPICHGPGKIHYAERESQAWGIPLMDCYFYTDHFTDIPLLQKVGHPYCINPDWRLRRIARRRGWPMLPFNRTLGRTTP